jgi:hypothetical protein
MENLDKAEDSIKAKIAHELYEAVGKVNRSPTFCLSSAVIGTH